LVEDENDYKQKYEEAIELLESVNQTKNALIKKIDELNEINDSAINELQFEKLQVDALYNAIDEIQTMTTDPLTKKVCEMAKERHQTDKLIHARNLFNK
jgi:heme oxygenase